MPWRLGDVALEVGRLDLVGVDRRRGQRVAAGRRERAAPRAATPPVSSTLTSLEAALTFVARLVRPFLSVRPSYSSLSEPAETTSL